MAKKWSEKLETGHFVKNDQTVTLRVYHAKRRVHGKMTGQCPGGCGAYLTDEEKQNHQCQRPPAHKVKRSSKRIRASLRRKVQSQKAIKVNAPVKPVEMLRKALGL